MKKSLIALFTAATLLSATPVMAASSFNDVPENNWAAPAINSMVEKQVIKGYKDGTFKPQNPVTKAEFAHMFHLLFPSVSNVPLESPPLQYADTKGHWAAADFAALFTNRLDASTYADHFTSDGKFYLEPNKQLTRWDVAIIVSALTRDMRNDSLDGVNLLDELSKYRDIKIRAATSQDRSKMYSPVILTMKYDGETKATFAGDVENEKAIFLYSAIHNGVIVGADGLFRPNDKVTRAEAAAILDRIYNQLNP